MVHKCVPFIISNSSGRTIGGMLVNESDFPPGKTVNDNHLDFRLNKREDGS